MKVYLVVEEIGNAWSYEAYEIKDAYRTPEAAHAHIANHEKEVSERVGSPYKSGLIVKEIEVK
jgi:hypothetical protein